MSDDVQGPLCPSPFDGEDIQLAHGGGGRRMHHLLRDLVLPILGDTTTSGRHDGAVLDVGGRLAFTTDSFVVHPLFFPGGDIGSLAVNGTVNDLAMCGARPRYLGLSMILEEGFPLCELRRVVESLARAAREADVRFVTGDTKVVERGRGHGLYLNTSGVGVVTHELQIEPRSVRAGDCILVSGDLGRHGIAVMAAREGLELETTLESDCAPLHRPVLDLLDAGIEIHCLRDLTRGGLASALIEIAEDSGTTLTIEEEHLKVLPDVQGACELLGFDPLYVANEGRFVLMVPERDADAALAIMRRHPVSSGGQRVGRVSTDDPGLVILKTRIGSARVVDMLSGEQLPRIC